MSDRTKTFLSSIMESRNFGPVLAGLVFVIVAWVAFFSPFHIFQWWDQEIGDRYFQLRTIAAPQLQQEGAVVQKTDDRVSPDILIVGVDNRSLDALGKWPFGRNLQADLLNTFTRIQDQTQRERAVFFDFFFLDREPVPENDLAFQKAIETNGRVLLETIYSPEALDPESAQTQFSRLKVLVDRTGPLGKLKGDWKALPEYMTIQAPLIPLGKVARSQGFATFTPDADQVFRRQSLVSKVVEVLGESEISELQPDLSDYDEQYQRYVYTNRDGKKVTLPSPLTPKVIAGLPQLLASDGLPRQVEDETTGDVRETYFIQKVQDIFLPSVTLSLALEYWHKTFRDIEVDLGHQIVIPNPEIWNQETAQWEPAPFGTVRIPIDVDGAMVINYVGPPTSESSTGYQSFPLRSFSSYASKAPSADESTWPESRQLQNKLIMVGTFSSGIVDDEKNTPFGQMYGVEMHANALNTILTRSFLVPVPLGLSLVALAFSVFGIGFLTSRAPAIWSLVTTVIWLMATFIGALVLFETQKLVFPYASLLVGTGASFVIVVVYRVLTEEREKRKVRTIFSKYVSPDVVTELLRHPPELGGVDKELTVLFSDIRGFTSLSEVMPPQELVKHLNVYLAAMTDIIHEYHGTLDKYVGDEIMCFWGAPLDQANHAELAAKCALKMMQSLDEMNSAWPEDRQIHIGIGLNSGVMTVGNMGSQGRMNYTLMGDNVNLGARLEGTNKEYLTSIIISEYTYQYLPKTSVVRELDNIRVKGKNKQVLIFELLDFEEGIDVPAIERKN